MYKIINLHPKAAEYYYQHTYYKTGEHYALYFANGYWRHSASVTNEELELYGAEIIDG